MQAGLTEAVDLALVHGFKQAMRRLASTITIVTTRHEDRRYGMVATAVCSLGVAPPSLLISVAEAASLHRPLHETGRFCVNLLGHESGDLVGCFSGTEKDEARFARGAWGEAEHGIPRLLDAQASLVCVTDRIVDHAGHAVLFGRVESVHVRDDMFPLLYADGRLAGLAFLAPTLHAAASAGAPA